MGMNKLKAGLLAVAIASVSAIAISPAQADSQEAIAIIDANFDSSLISGDVLNVCVVGESACSRVSQPKTASQFKNFNHGTIMADVVRQNNPNAKLVLIRAATVTTNVINGIGFEAALDWIQENRDSLNITKVSFSYNVGDGSKCLPGTPGYNASSVHADIVGDISNLLARGTKVYAAAGNYSKPQVDYPACISDVISVGSGMYRGSMPFADIVIGSLPYVSNSLKSNSKTLQDSAIISAVGSFPVVVGNTTSVATAIVAATN